MRRRSERRQGVLKHEKARESVSQKTTALVGTRTLRIAFSMPNLRYATLWAHQPPEVMSYLRDRVTADLQTLDAVLSRTTFLLPSGPTIADLSCSAYLFWLSQVDVAEDEYSHIARWLQSLRALPGWVHPDRAMAATARPTV
jgi:glutathione S-transferase